MIQALVFDLDDTLYPEKDFVESGYRAVAHHIAEHHGCDFEIAVSTMIATFNSLGREKVFNALLVRFAEASIRLDELIHVYRSHTPAICLFPGYRELLTDLARQYRMGVITDGLPSVQERKVQALGLESVVEKILYTWKYGAQKQKPHPFPFSLMLEFLGATPECALYIGDNPEKDCRGAHSVGMKYAEIRHPESLRDRSDPITRYKPEFVIDTLFQLPQILRQMSRDG
jgi:putative hydrolase of the HAD superfamily